MKLPRVRRHQCAGCGYRLRYGFVVVGDLARPGRDDLPEWWHRSCWNAQPELGITVGFDASHVAYMGETCDHLYANCPGLQRTGRPIKECSGGVDPLGDWICLWCQRVYRARHKDAA